MSRQTEIYRKPYGRMPFGFLVRHPVRAILLWAKQRRTAAELAKLDDRQLEDVGFSNFAGSNPELVSQETISARLELHAYSRNEYR